jgi:hypothetical protein
VAEKTGNGHFQRIGSEFHRKNSIIEPGKVNGQVPSDDRSEDGQRG